MICFVKTIIAWFIMMFIGTNLLGLLVRGRLGRPFTNDEISDKIKELHLSEPNRAVRLHILTFVSAVLTIIYFVALYYLGNMVLVAAGVLLMVSRLPDLLWEIRTGTKVLPKGGVYIVTMVIPWLSLLVIWFALCK